MAPAIVLPISHPPPEETSMAIDQDNCMDFRPPFVGYLGATINAGNVVVGHHLGLYKALAEGPATPAELAERTGTHPRYIAECLRGQAAGGYVVRDSAAAEETYSMTEEQAFALTSEDNPVYAPGAFVLALGPPKGEPRVTESFRTGSGVGWGEQDDDVFVGCEQFFRPGYIGNLTSGWIPALDGVEQKLQSGGSVADTGCGLGATSVLMAQAYPAAQVTGAG